MAEFDSIIVHPLRTLALASLVAFGACDGPNVFSTPLPTDGGGGADEPPTVEILKPRSDSLSAKPLGDSLLVEARVTDSGGLARVDFIGLSRRGDPDLGTEEVVTRFSAKTVQLAAATDTVVRRYLQPTSDMDRDTARIYVTVTDTEGNSAVDSVSVVLGGPDVELRNLEDGFTVVAGKPLSLQMVARDPIGLLRVEFQLTGAVEATVGRVVDPIRDTVAFDTIVAIPSGARGAVQVVATAVNDQGLRGQDGPLTLNVVAGGGADAIAPTASLSVTAAPRMELGDSTTVVVSGRDDDQGDGIRVVGYTVVARSAHAGDTIVTDSVVFETARTGPVSRQFRVPMARVDSLTLPDTLRYEVTGFVVDAAGNCAAAVSGESQQLTCGVEGGARVAQNQTGLRVDFEALAGRTVQLPSGGLILDAVVDTARRNLLLSNYGRDRVEIFRLQTEQFLPSVPVGSEPWGLALNRPKDGSVSDTLLVANSGGTNISNVYLGGMDGTGPFREDTGRRFLTPDVVLFDVELAPDEFGRLRYNVFVKPVGSPGFSDRPQYVAVDSTGRILISTKETLLGDFGTIRKIFFPEGVNPATDGAQPEVVLFTQHAALERNPNFRAVANVDDVYPTAEGDRITMVDHPLGFPNATPLVATGDSVASAAAGLGDQSDVVVGVGRFSIPSLGFSDTTYVTASGDGGWVAFGEGSVSPIGRIIMYDAGRDVISDVISVSDLGLNASEVVRGIGLNYDGTLGVARGEQAYFFTTDLRLQGVADLLSGGAGAVMHPLHAHAQSLDNPTGGYRPNTHMAFIGTGANTIDIVDTFHFFLSGRIFIRDVISGPLRAVLPFAEDNEGKTCRRADVTDKAGNVIGQAVEVFAGDDFNDPHPATGNTPTEDACVVVKLFGISNTGGVVVVDVRKSDILRNHPFR